MARSRQADAPTAPWRYLHRWLADAAFEADDDEVGADGGPAR